jgi:hypothetical protein
MGLKPFLFQNFILAEIRGNGYFELMLFLIIPVGKKLGLS